MVGVKVEIYRNRRDGAEFHIHLVGSHCENFPTNETNGTEVEMPESVYQAFANKFTTQGYVTVPADMLVSEAVSDWWSVALMLIP